MNVYATFTPFKKSLKIIINKWTCISQNEWQTMVECISWYITTEDGSIHVERQLESF